MIRCRQCCRRPNDSVLPLPNSYVSFCQYLKDLGKEEKAINEMFVETSNNKEETVVEIQCTFSIRQRSIQRLLQLKDERLERPVVPLPQYLKDLGKEKKDIDEMILETSKEKEETAIGNLQMPMNESKMKDDTVDKICEKVKVSERFI